MTQKITTVAEAFRHHRIQSGLSVREVAERCEPALDPGTIWRIERGAHPNPRMETVRAVAEVLEVSPADLLPEGVAA